MRDLTFHQVLASGLKGKPTLVPQPDFNPETAAKGLKDAMAGLGTDEFSIIMILGSCTSDQRQEIKKTFKGHYGRDLISELKSELSGNFKTLIVYMLCSWDEMYARALYDAIDGAGTKESVIIEILCTLSPPEIEAVKVAYRELLTEKGKDANRTLEGDLKDDLSGDFESLVVALLQGTRDQVSYDDVNAYYQGSKNLCEIIDADRARQDAEDLYNAGEGKWGTDESTFISTFVNRSKFSLWATNEIYQESYGSTLLEAVSDETSGTFRKALKLLFLAQLDPKAAYVKILREAMEGLGTSDKKLMRVIVDRSEIDLMDIAEHYLSETGENLMDRISSETSGDYKKMLLKLCGKVFD